MFTRFVYFKAPCGVEKKKLQSYLIWYFLKRDGCSPYIPTMLGLDQKNLVGNDFKRFKRLSD